MPRVSVLMAAYNAANFLRDTIDSVLGQSFGDFEFVIIDDCSTDATADVIASYSDTRIRFIRNDRNLGVSRTRNVALDAAQGEYLAALDHDDLAHPDRLARQIEFMDTHRDVVLLGTASIARFGDPSQSGAVIREIHVPAITAPHLLHWALFHRCPMIHSSTMIRASAMRARSIYYSEDYPFADDFELYHQLARVGGIACLADELTIKREFDEQASQRHTERMEENGRRFLLGVYRNFVGNDIGEDDIALMWTTLTLGRPAPSRDALLRLGQVLNLLLRAFLDKVPLSEPEQADIRAAASRNWWSAVGRTAKDLGPGILSCYRAYPEINHYNRSPVSIIRTAAVAALGPSVTSFLRSKQAN